MATSWKSVRVFISSTFRDMQAERDHLVRFVFPRLREQLLKRRIHLVDVDLRWGVTSEQDATEVCREIIDECRPRFLCMLGGRYGWVPPGKTRSITADEVHYGVLDQTFKSRGFSYFYFRDEAATAAMVETAPGEFREPLGSDNQNKLAELKLAIIAEGLNPLTYPAQWDNESGRLTGFKKFGDRVHDDLLDSLRSDPELRDRFVTDPASQLDEFDEEDAAMEAFVEERSERFVLGSREAVLEELLAHASATGGNGYVCLTGAPGSGKSALLAHLSRHSILNDQPSALFIRHFVGASPGSTDVRRTLRRLCHELKAGCAGITADIPDDPERLRGAFIDFLRQASASKRVVILLDAVNQFDQRTNPAELQWLPQELPDNARIILSALDGPALEDLRSRPGKPREIDLKPLTAADCEAIIEQFRKRYRKKLEPDQIELLLGEDESGKRNKTDSEKPLYLLAALEELRTLGTYEEITGRIAELPTTTEGLFAWILGRLENDDGFRDAIGRPVGSELVSRFAALLCASRYGLSHHELTNLLDPGDPQGNVAAMLHLLRPYLMRRGELLDFYHGQFRAAAAQAWLNTDERRQAAHEALADYFETIEFSKRSVDELPWQLKCAERKDRLIRCLTEVKVFLALYTSELQYDLLSYWNWLEKDSDPAAAYREAVFRFRGTNPMPSTLCRFTHQVARLLAWMSRYPAAEEQYRSALTLAEAIFGPESLEAAAIQSNLAELLTASGRHDEAGDHYRVSLQVAESHPEDPRALGIALSNLGHWCHANGDFAGAEALIRRALAIHEASRGSDSEEAAVDRLNLAGTLTELSRFKEAEPYCRRALDSFLARFGSAHPETARCQGHLALILHRTGRLREAEALYFQALATYEGVGKIHSEHVVALRHNLSWLLMENSRSTNRL